MISLLEAMNETLRGITPWALLGLGAVLAFYAPRYRIALQLRVKDHELTEERARLQAELLRWSAPVMAGLGLVLLSIDFATLLLVN